MSIKGVIFSNQKVSAADHGRLFRRLFSDGVLYGCSASTSTTTSGGVITAASCTISSGSIIACGRLINISSDESIDIPLPNPSQARKVRITGVIDLSRIAEKDEFEQFTFRVDTAATVETLPALVQQDINNGSNTYEFMFLMMDQAANGALTITQRMGESEGGGTTPEPSPVSFPTYTYTGDHEIKTLSDGSWVIVLKTTGDLQFSNFAGASKLDIFAVGGGGAGSAVGAGGGGGGYTSTVKNVNAVLNTTYGVTVGAGGSAGNYAVTPRVEPQAGGASSVVLNGSTIISANGGQPGSFTGSGMGIGGDGGSGGSGLCSPLFCPVGGSDGSNGYAYNSSTQGSDGASQYAGHGQGTTTRAFGDPDGEIYAGGGAGGSKYAWDTSNNKAVFTDEAYWNSVGKTTRAPGGGGRTGGPQDGMGDWTPGVGGSPRDGTGGGGGASRTRGSSGVVLVRAHKE